MAITVAEFNKVKVDVSTLQGDMVAVQGDVKHVKETVEDHDKFINGNGKEGAVETLAVLKLRMDQVYGLMKVVVGIFATVAGGLLLYLFTQVLGK